MELRETEQQAAGDVIDAIENLEKVIYGLNESVGAITKRLDLVLCRDDKSHTDSELREVASRSPLADIIWKRIDEINAARLRLDHINSLIQL